MALNRILYVCHIVSCTIFAFAIFLAPKAVRPVYFFFWESSCEVFFSVNKINVNVTLTRNVLLAIVNNYTAQMILTHDLL